jgi:hypothetical protein
MDFFTKRDQITQVMSKMVNEVFTENYGELIMLLITDVSLDATSEKSIENQQASKQKAATAVQQQ